MRRTHFSSRKQWTAPTVNVMFRFEWDQVARGVKLTSIPSEKILSFRRKVLSVEILFFIQFYTGDNWWDQKEVSWCTDAIARRMRHSHQKTPLTTLVKLKAEFIVEDFCRQLLNCCSPSVCLCVCVFARTCVQAVCLCEGRGADTCLRAWLRPCRRCCSSLR